jgi:hypothetical protein
VTGHGFLQYGLPIIWFIYSAVIVIDFLHGRSGWGHYLNAERATQPRMFWTYVSWNAAIVGFGWYVFIDGTVNGWQ